MQGCGHLLRAAKGKALAMIVVRCVFSILLAVALFTCVMVCGGIGVRVSDGRRSKRARSVIVIVVAG